VTLAFAVAGLIISGSALGVAATSAWFSRQQLYLAERQRERDFEATVVAELVRFSRSAEMLDYELRVTNAGPAVARDVDVSIVVWTDDGPLGRTIHTVDVAPALLRGEQRTVTLRLPVDEARFDDRSRSIEIASDYFDDNGVRNVRLAFVFDGDLVLTPPQPPYPSGRRLNYPPGS
jgi:hypothetical protein